MHRSLYRAETDKKGERERDRERERERERERDRQTQWERGIDRDVYRQTNAVAIQVQGV